MRECPLDRNFLIRCLIRSGMGLEAAEESADTIIRQWHLQESDREARREPGPDAG